MRKIRIKKEGGPLYHQNTNMSLNQGMVVQKDKEPVIKNTIDESSTPNTEVEKGEVVLKGDNSQLLKVGGKPHYMGGTKVELDAGDFVFSHYLKTPEELKSFLGGTKKDKSFADLIKKHVKDYNQSIHDLNTTDDLFLKNAASFTAKGVLDKATKIALVQESLKSFPNGIPSFIQNDNEDLGQEEFMQKGGGKKVDRKDFDEALRKGFKQRKDSSNYADKTTQTIIKGRGPEITLEIAKKNRGTYNTFWKTYGPNATEADANEFFNLGVRNKNKETIFYENSDRHPMVGKERFNRPFTNLKPVEKSSELPEVAVSTKAKKPNPISINQTDINTYSKPFTDTGYGTMDVVSMLSPFLNPINRYAPIRQKIIAPELKPNLVDFTQQRQSIKGMGQTMSNQNNLISPSVSVASSRNAQLLSQITNPIAESFSNEFNTNQQIKNQANIYNQEAALKSQSMNVQLSDDYNTKTAQMNENFDAQKAFRNNKFLQSWFVADKRRQARNAFNYLNTDYQVGPNGEIDRLKYDSERMMTRAIGETGSNTKLLSYEDWVSSNTGPGGRYKGISNESTLVRLYEKDMGETDRYSITDTDNDGVPNRVTRNTRKTPNLFQFMTDY